MSYFNFVTERDLWQCFEMNNDLWCAYFYLVQVASEESEVLNSPTALYSACPVVFSLPLGRARLWIRNGLKVNFMQYVSNQLLHEGKDEHSSTWIFGNFVSLFDQKKLLLQVGAVKLQICWKTSPSLLK